MSTCINPEPLVGQSGRPFRRGQSSRRVLTVLSALACLAGANVYFFRGFLASPADSAATGWTLFQLEAPPPPIYATGSVRSIRSARVSPALAGVVSRVIPDKFAHVRAGDVLIELDSRASQVALDQDRLALETAQVEEAGARQYLSFLEAQAARLEKLRQDGLIADSTFQEALSNARKQEFQARLLHKHVEAASLSLKKSQDQIDQMSIKSPIDGVVTEVAVTPGQFVAPGGTGDQASTLLTVTSLKDLNVQLSVDEIDVSRITLGQQIDLKIDALPGKIALARVRQVAKSPIPQQNGKPGVTYEVDMDLLKYPPQLTVGMSVFASISDVKSAGRYLPLGAIQHDAIQHDAIQHDATGSWVWIIDQDKLHKQAIEVGEQRDDQVLLRSGLDRAAEIIYGTPILMRSLAEGQSAPRLK
ncbi:MAG TPA: efflux RND transporter periplasmic adaptor subunit [Blastocatellia bacterium]|nr:efflux RND transporter periplasmic adaptor subunit [Blastocatellia bacterium]